MNKSIKKILILVIILISLNAFFSVKVFASEGDITVSGDNYYEMKLDNGNYYSSFKENIEPNTSVQLKVEYEQNGQNVDVTDLCTWESDDTSVVTVEKGCITAISKKTGFAHVNMTYKEHEREIFVIVGEKEKIGWDFKIDKSSIVINEGEEIDISIVSKYYGMDIALYEEVTDYWNVDWKIKDESIASCKKVTGIVTDRGKGLAGKATIKGLKSGTTTLVGKVVDVENNNFVEGASKEFEINVTVCSKDGESKIIVPIETKEDLSKETIKNILIIGGIGVIIGMLLLGGILLIIKKIKS